jgi:hypothetical protein
MTYLRTLVIAIGVTIPTLALAQQGGVRGACITDIKTLCGSVQPGGGRIRECFREHRAQLSDGCKVALAERRAERRQNKGAQGSEAPKPGEAPKD